MKKRTIIISIFILSVITVTSILLLHANINIVESGTILHSDTSIINKNTLEFKQTIDSLEKQRK